jgi:hypothetical protein
MPAYPAPAAATGAFGFLTVLCTQATSLQISRTDIMRKQLPINARGKQAELETKVVRPLDENTG